MTSWNIQNGFFAPPRGLWSTNLIASIYNIDRTNRLVDFMAKFLASMHLHLRFACICILRLRTFFLTLEIPISDRIIKFVRRYCVSSLARWMEWIFAPLHNAKLELPFACVCVLCMHTSEWMCVSARCIHNWQLETDYGRCNRIQ